MKAVLCHHAARFRLQEVIKIGFLGTLDVKIHKNGFFFSFFLASIVRYAHMMTTDML